MMDTSMILDHWPWCIYFCIHDVYIYDPWSWCMFMMHVCMMHIYTILDPDHDWYIYDSWSLTLMHIFLYPYNIWSLIMMHVCMIFVCMMHISIIPDPDYDGYIYDSWSLTLMQIFLYPRCIHIWSLIMMHVCMMRVWTMRIPMILDPVICIYDAGLFRYGRTDERTDGQADSRSWIIIFRHKPYVLYLMAPTLKLSALITWPSLDQVTTEPSEIWNVTKETENVL